MTASSIEAPRAMQDAIPLDKVHPVPWVWREFKRGQDIILAPSFVTRTSKTDFPFKCPPFIKAE